MKQHKREKSDLQNDNQKLLNRVNQTEKSIENILESMHSVCTIVLCLLETSCMQIRAEEQDDEDK